MKKNCSCGCHCSEKRVPGETNCRYLECFSGDSEFCGRGSYHKGQDEWLLPIIRAIVDERPTYGYPRTTAMLNRRLRAQGKARVNHKRVYRIMKRNGLLLERHVGGPARVHEGEIITLVSNLRWCSDIFEISCWNGEGVRVAFVIDCCDREVISYLASTSGISGGDDPGFDDRSQ